jgi:methyl-accepting chemotaxis protein
LPEPEVKHLIDVIEQGIASYKEGFNGLIPQLERGEILSAGVGNQLMLEHRKGYSAAAKAIDDLQRHVQDRVTLLVQSQKKGAERLKLALSFIAIGGLVSSVLIGWLLLRSVKRQLDRALALSQRIARGDLRDEAHADEAGEIGRIVMSMTNMQLDLRTLVKGVQTGASDVAMSSAEIANGSGDLSDRTEQSAKLLQELSSRLAEVDALAETSKRQSENASALAHRMSEDAQTSIHESTQAALIMQKVTSDAIRIGDITDIING